MKRDKRKQQLPRHERKHTQPPLMCAYCGLRPGHEEEHVIASCFFGGHKPRNMITVPACAECNRGRGDGGQRNLNLDEEYVRQVLALQGEPDNNPVILSLIKNEVPRAFQNSPKLADRILGTTEWRTYFGPRGLDLLPQPTFAYEVERVTRVIRKIIRGLYYHLERQTMPVSVPIHVIPGISPEKFHLCRGLFGDSRWHGVNHVVAFKCCKLNFTDAQRYDTVWLFIWYKKFIVMAMSGTLTEGLSHVD